MRTHYTTRRRVYASENSQLTWREVIDNIDEAQAFGRESVESYFYDYYPEEDDICTKDEFEKVMVPAYINGMLEEGVVFDFIYDLNSAKKAYSWLCQYLNDLCEDAGLPFRY